MDTIYLDYNATTPIDKEVAAEMRPYLEHYFGNPSSSHSFGVKTKLAVEKARKQLALLINCNSDEIIFTSGGTESNNYAIKGAAFANRENGSHIITTSVEHPAVIEVCRYLEKQGFEVTYLGVDEYGLINPQDVKRAVRQETILISVMHANNEIGTIQPINEISEIAKSNNILFHTDAAQSLGKINVDVREMGVDMLTIAGHKLYGPKGIGVLYKKKSVKIEKLIHGADHEQNFRAGTENVLEIVGLGKAAEVAKRDLKSNSEHFKNMRDLLYEGILKEFPWIKLNGHPEKCLPNTLNISFAGIEANTLISELDDLAVSAGAACHTGEVDVSSVLEAMKIPVEFAMGTIRFSTGKHTSELDIKNAIAMVVESVKKLKGENKLIADEFQDKSVKLTNYTHGMGCACKLNPLDLEKVLKKLNVPNDPNILVDLHTSDDAAVYKIDGSKAIVSTVDFLTPVVDDPFHFGEVATANALSDIYAMGARPLFALNIIGFPQNRLPLTVLEKIMKGAQKKADEAGIPIIGGHTIEDTEPKFGMAVTGIVDENRILANSHAKSGDVIILTKPIGVGIISTAVKKGLVSDEAKNEALNTMRELNKYALEAIIEFDIHACTDVTGFGLAGHLKEICLASNIDAVVEFNKVPMIDTVKDLVAANVIPGGAYSNLEYVSKHIDWDENIAETDKLILCDPQTSGGLMFTVDEKIAEQIIKKLISKGIHNSSIIGKCVGKGNRIKVVY